MAGSTSIRTQSIAEWCAKLDDMLEDKTLSPEDRAEIEGVKKAMERQGFKMAKQARGCPFKLIPPEGVNGA